MITTIAQTGETRIQRKRSHGMFRILTENRNMEEIKRALVCSGLDYTLYATEGCWKGKNENSIAIELDNTTRAIAEALALNIKRVNRQQAVLLQEIPARSIFV